jgi:uncharacterized Zn finger protein (UPF0148 family)
MAKGVSYTHKAFSCKPSRALSLKSKSSTELVPVSLDTVLNDLRSDIRLLTGMVEYQLAADPEIRSRVASMNGKPANAAGRQLGYTLPPELLPEAGASRFLMLFRDKLVRETRSWNARTEAENGEREASPGWKRTADSTRPTDLVPKISLSAVDNQYALLLWEPDLITLRLVIKGVWYELQFDTDLSRFNKYAPFNKITLPDIRENSNGELVFSFTAAYEKVYPEISSQYVVGVDVGKNSFYAASVLDTETKRIVYSTLGSLRVRRLTRSCKSTEKQIRFLTRKSAKLRRLGLHLPENRSRNDNILREIVQQRSKLSRKKRELAILAAQEVVYLSYKWGNAPISVEELSWIVNTMATGRWNRGEFVNWLTDYAIFNGTIVKKVNASNTSQICYVCKTPVSHPEHGVSVCATCGTEINRDIGASGEVASRCVNYFAKVAENRKKHQKRVKRIASRVPKTDRTKSSPTPKRPRVKKKEVKLPSRPLTGATAPTVVRDAESIAMASARLISATPNKASTQNWSPD